MDVFNIGTPEVLLLLGLLLVLFGPEELLRIAQRVGAFLGYLRRLWDDTLGLVTQNIAQEEEPLKGHGAGSATRSY